MKASKLGFVTQEISSAISGDSRSWRACVQSAGVVTENDFYALVAERSKLPVEVVAHVNRCATRTKKALVREGRQVNEGDTSYFPVIGGSFARPDSPFTPGVNRIEVVAVAHGSMRTCLSDITPVNLIKPPAPSVQSVMDLTTGVEWTLTQGNTVGFAGRNLAPDSTREDEKVWFEKDGEKIAEGTIVSSDLQIVNVTFSLWPQPGEYTICLATRSGLPADYTLVTVRKAVTVVAPSNGNV